MKKEIQGTIHTVFNGVCNITFKDSPIVSLLFESVPMKPMAIYIKQIREMSMHKRVMEAEHCIYQRATVGPIKGSILRKHIYIKGR
jgi:hypothetical protein